MRTADFDFVLPPGQIARTPAPRREDARLLVLERDSGARAHAHFRDLALQLPRRSLLVLNDTRVIPARLRGRKASGGAVELLLTRSMSRTAAAYGILETWEALGRGLGGGDRLRLDFEGGLSATVLERRGEGRVIVEIEARGAGSVLERLDDVGEVPLPPYIEAARREAGAPAADPTDRERYQTVYAAHPGAVAAPTAGLHFTPALLEGVRAAGHDTVAITLHVGPGTFRPVKTEDPRQHLLEVERYEIPPAAAAAVTAARAQGRPIVAVGTTVVRALEASARAHDGQVAAGPAETDLLLLPGDRFHVTSGLITNFHLPRSTLLMLVSAFGGRERVLDAYADAVARGYRFYSYGDAMLVREAGA